MKVPAAILVLRIALLLGALLCTRASDAQDGAEVTRDDILPALLEGDYDGVDARLNALQQRFEQDDTAEEALLLGFQPFRSVQSDTEAAVEQALVVWVERYPRSYAARLARGIFYIERGLDSRGTEYASKTSARQFEEMERWFERGRKDLRASLELSAKPLLSHMWLITQAMRSGADDDEQRYYRAALEYAPRSIELRVLYMTRLEPRWGGSYEAMEAHAKESEAALGPGSQTNRLYRMIAEDRGHVLMDAQKYDAAHAVYTEAIERYGGRGVRCGRARARDARPLGRGGAGRDRSDAGAETARILRRHGRVACRPAQRSSRHVRAGAWLFAAQPRPCRAADPARLGVAGARQSAGRIPGLRPGRGAGQRVGADHGRTLRVQRLGRCSRGP